MKRSRSLIGLPVLVILVLFSIQAHANLVIITPEDFESALSPLVDHKNDTGMTSHLLTLEYIDQNFTGYDLPEKVKKAILDYHENYNVSYVLLVGDTDRFPVRYIKAVNTEWATRYYPSDLYYADLYNSSGYFDDWDYDNDGFYGETDFSGGQDSSKVNLDKINLKPDVVVGRIPASTTNEVTIYVNKVIQYELGNSWRPEWSNQALIISDHNTDKAFSDQTHATSVANSLDNFSLTLLYKAQSPYKDMEPSQLPIEIKNFINNGQDLIFHMGHGNQNEWTGFFTSSDMSMLTNFNRLPIITTIACLTATFHYGPEIWQADKYLTTTGTVWDGQGITKAERPMPASIQPTQYDVESMAEEFLVKRASGAIAYIGTVAKAEHGVKSLQRYFADETNAHVSNSWKRTLGEIWISSLYPFMENECVPGMGLYFAYIHQHKTMLFGDPSLRIGKRVPPVFKSDEPKFALQRDLTLGLPGDQPSLPKTAYNSKHNEYLVVYHYKNDFLFPVFKRQIHAARMSADGAYIANYTISDLSNNCAQPDVAYDPDKDQYLVVWSYDTYNDDSYWDIYGRYVPWNGPSATSSSFRIGGVSSTAGSKWNPRVAYGAANKDFLVVNTVIDSGTHPFITGFRVPAKGSASWLYATIKGDPLNYEKRMNPDIAYSNSRKQFMVVYDDMYHIFGKIFNGIAFYGSYIPITDKGIPITQSRPPDLPLPGTHDRPSVAYSEPADYYVITWDTNRLSGKGEIYARYFPGGATLSDRALIERIDDDTEPDFSTDVACSTKSSNCFALWLRVHQNTYFTFASQLLLKKDASLAPRFATGFHAPLNNLYLTNAWTNDPHLSIAAGKNNFYVAFTGKDSNSTKWLSGRNSISHCKPLPFLPLLLLE